MLEPVNTVLKAVKRLNLLPGDNVLVAGQGPIGLMFTKILQLQGIRVLATDLLESRLRLAKKFGAKWTANVSSSGRESAHYSCSVGKSQSRLTSAATIRDLDAAIIAVPSDVAVQQALQLVRGGGQVLLFAHTKRSPVGRVTPCAPSDELGAAARKGLTRPTAFSLDPASICLDEKDLIGSYSSDFTLQAEVARLVFSRRLDVRQLITHRFPLAETGAAVQLAASPRPDSLKILVQIENRNWGAHPPSGAAGRASRPAPCA